MASWCGSPGCTGGCGPAEGYPSCPGCGGTLLSARSSCACGHGRSRTAPLTTTRSAGGNLTWQQSYLLLREKFPEGYDG